MLKSFKMLNCRCFLIFLYATTNLVRSSRNFDPNKVIYAVNAGGEAFVDSLGIKYDRDPLHQKIGVASDFGKSLTIRRVSEHDYPLYQVERYHNNNFGYDIPIGEDGDFLLVLKFCEVYFTSRNSKVFDVTLNDVQVIDDLDIYDKVGKGAAHDEYIPFSVRDNVLVYKDRETFINNGKIRVEFVKGRKDNPKVNAVIVYKGSSSDFPKLIPLQYENEYEEEPYHERKTELPPSSNTRKPYYHNRVHDDPYAFDDSWISYWPILVTVVFAIPIAFCLYKITFFNSMYSPEYCGAPSGFFNQLWWRFAMSIDTLHLNL